MSVGTNHSPTATHLLAGTPCWVDIATREMGMAQTFYRGLFGWTFQADPGGYLTAFADDEPVAGLYPRAQSDQPSGWTLYLAVTNSTLTAELVPEFGGQILLEPQELPGQGSVLVGTDPSGGVIGFWQTRASWRFGTGFPGAFSWAELNTWNGAAADDFFAGLFHYRQEQIGDGANFDYTTWALADDPVLGRQRMGAEFPVETAPHWMVYFEIGPELGVDSACDRIRRLGGRVTVDPFDSPYGRVCVAEDPAGAVFTVIDTSRRTSVEDTEDEHRAEVDDPYDD